MCGICGQFNFQSRQPVVETLIRAATHTLAHRGPDDEGFFFAGAVGLGFRRLSIIDLGLGHQPMSDDSGSICVVFNGEIYNYRELRRQLTTFGHQFRTSSDTEVIVYGYKQWGDKVFDHLNGMFGLAIWDGTRQRLVLARDAMGIKPVDHTVTNGGIYFGSEIRAVTRMLRGDVALDSTSLNLFLRYRYTPSPLTLFTGIRKLAPGTMVVVDEKSPRVERWYQFKPRLHAPTKTFREAKHELLGLYRDAVRRHLISDVPVGLLLSAGVDSGLLLALMNDEGGGRPTYTVGYGSSFPGDELVAAAQTAAHFKTRHVSVELTPESFERYLPAVVRSLEEPVAAASIVPMFAVCERARQDVKVALVGQGPDELFGGYRRHLGVYYGEYWRRLPAGVRRLAGACLGRLPRSAGIKRGLFALDLPDRTRRYQNAFSILPGHTVDGLFRDGILEPGAGDTILDCWSGLEAQMGGTDELGAFQLLEVRSSLPDELLIYADKLSMAHGLEVRVPYLDREVVEYAQCLRSDLKIRWSRQKYIHRKICSSFLPADVTRRKKLGFAGNVVDGWFKRSVSARLDELLLDGNSRMYGYLKPEAVGALLKAHRAGLEDHHKILFSLVVLEMWLRTSMESTRTDSTSEPVLEFPARGAQPANLGRNEVSSLWNCGNL